MTHDIRNLNDDTSDSFPFIMDGFTYTMKYPTLDEVEEVKKAMDDSGDDVTKILETISKFITPEKSDAPNIVKALKSKNIKVLQNFNKMIKEEFIGDEE